MNTAATTLASAHRDSASPESTGRGEAIAAPVAPRPLRLLLAAAADSHWQVLAGSLASDGFEVADAAAGADVLARFLEFRPDLVLLDMALPGMDPFTAMARVQKAAGVRWVPVVLLAPSSDPGLVVHGLEAGASDVLLQPVNLAVARARLNSLRRIAEMHVSLRHYRDNAETEAALARGIMERMIDSDGLRDPRIVWRVIPAATFSGDQIAAARGPSGRFYTLLADVAGHGLAAAITLLPMLLVFYSLARKDFPVSEMVTEMNRKLRGILVPGKYSALALVCHDPARREIEYWNGGLPAGLLLDRRGHVVIELPSSHLPLGVLDEDAFDASCEMIDTDGSAAVVLYSDGLIEAQDVAGAPFGKERLRQCVMGPGAGIDARIHGQLQRHLAGRPLHDDVSYLTIGLDRQEPAAI